jgi:hypothetical protein
MSNHSDPAVSLIEELDEQDLSGEAGSQAGGFFTIPGTYTVGKVCTLSWECQKFLCGS